MMFCLLAGVLFSAANFLGNINLMSGIPVFGTERVVSRGAGLQQLTVQYSAAGRCQPGMQCSVPAQRVSSASSL